MKQSRMIRAALCIGVFAFAIACTVGMLSTCSTELIEDIQDDITAQKEKDALEEEEGKTPETRIPVISVFTWSAVEGGKTDNPTVAFNLSAEAKAVSTSGAATIAGYFLKENTTAPAITDAGWLTAAPTSYAFSAEVGERNLYLWVKDSLGNLSSGSALAVTLEPLGWASSGIYLEGITVPAHEQFQFTSKDVVVAEGATISGIGAGGVSVDSSGKIVTLAPTAHWSTGTQTLTLTVRTQYGLPLTKTLGVKLFNGVCVSTTSNGGDDGHDGMAREPYATISAGISGAASRYSGILSEVHVTTGTHSISSDIEMREGISLLGGYSTNWIDRSWVANTTTITDTRTSDCSTIVFPADGAITDDTVLEGFMINAATSTGAGSTTSAILVQSASPIIRNNRIYAGGDAVSANRYGVYINDSSNGVPSPQIIGNYINTATIGGGSNCAISTGIQIEVPSSSRIENNIIYGGSVSSTGTVVGISSILNSEDLIITKNTIYAGKEGSTNNTIQIAFNTGQVCVTHNLLISKTTVTEADRIVVYHHTSGPSASLYLRNNTIIFSSRASSSYGSFAIRFLGVQGERHIDNNLFYYCVSSSTGAWFVYEDASFAPVELRNNDFWFIENSPVFYHDASGGDLISITDINGTAPDNNGSGNISINPYLDENTYELTASTPSTIRDGGIAGDSTVFWGFGHDRNGMTRSDEDWSIGCFE